MATLELPHLLMDAVTAVAHATRPILLSRDPGPAETDVPIDTTIAPDRKRYAKARPSGVDERWPW